MGTSEKLSKLCETRMEDIAARLNVRAGVFVCLCMCVCVCVCVLPLHSTKSCPYSGAILGGLLQPHDSFLFHVGQIRHEMLVLLSDRATVIKKFKHLQIMHFII